MTSRSPAPSPWSPPGGLLPLLLGSLLSLSLLGARVVVNDNRVTFVFLIWNLFLAVLPLLFALLLRRLVDGRAPVVAVVAVGALWLLFLPNAPYLVSDLVHLRPRPGAPHWIDVTMLASFAITGLWLGGAALAVVDGVVRARAGQHAAVVAACFDTVVAVLAGFGVHLGRFDRWNSWDALHHPGAVLRDAVENAADVRALAFSAVFAVLLLATMSTMNSRARSTI